MHQTRDHFIEKLGGIVDNNQVCCGRMHCPSHTLPTSLHHCQPHSTHPGVQGSAFSYAAAVLVHTKVDPYWSLPRNVECPCRAVLCPCSCGAVPYPVSRLVGLQVGKDLTDVYWRPGNGAMFLDLVQQLTGKPLAADAWVARLQRDTASLLAREKEQYEAAVKAGPK